MVEISIIFPTYNGEKYLYRNLNSIKNLVNLNEIEIVIVDNNSIDSTKEIIKSFNNININLIGQDCNSGFAKACNIGVINAKGKYIFITNQDVLFPKNFFKIVLNLYNNMEKDGDLILCPAVVFRGKKINYFGGKIHFLCISYTPDMYSKIPKKKLTFKTHKVTGCSMFMKREAFLKLNGFDSYFFMYKEDIDFSLRAIRNHVSIYTTNETLIFHQKTQMMLNDFNYYYIERNRYLCMCKNLDNLKSLIPYVIISEFILLFQAFLEKKLKIRFRIYKFLIQNYKQIKDLRSNKINNSSRKIKKIQLASNLDSIILGKFTSNKILRFFLKIINLIF